jgi:hypothetical protein
LPQAASSTAMTACPEEESKVLDFRSEKPRGQPQVATKKLNGFAKWETHLSTWIWLSFQLDRRLLRFRVLLSESWALLRNEQFALTSGTMGLAG